MAPVVTDRRDTWTTAPTGNDQDLEESLIDAAYRVRDLAGVELLERSGDWLWLHARPTGTDAALTAAGFKKSFKKSIAASTPGHEVGVWYWSPTERKPGKRYRGNVSQARIRARYGAVSLKDE